MKKGAVICWAFIILVIGGVVVFFTWVGDKKFKSPVFTVESAVISDYNFTTNDQFSAAFNINLFTKNPDKRYNYYYDSLMVDIYYNGSTLAYDNLGPVTQRHGTETTFVAAPVARNVSVTDAIAAADLRGEIKTGKELRLNVRILANAKITLKGWHTWRYTLSSICYPVVFDLRTGKTSAKADCFAIIFS